MWGRVTPIHRLLTEGVGQQQPGVLKNSGSSLNQCAEERSDEKARVSTKMSGKYGSRRRHIPRPRKPEQATSKGRVMCGLLKRGQ